MDQARDKDGGVIFERREIVRGGDDASMVVMVTERLIRC